MELRRAISIDQLERMKFKSMNFSGKWADAIGEVVAMRGSWIVYGPSGHGKTEFTIQLAKKLTKYGKVAFDTIEEGASLTFQKAILRNNITASERKKMIILDEEINELIERLSRQKSPDIIIIDSLQFANITKAQYKEMVRMFPTKLFIWISHADGKKPLGALGVYVEYNSHVKIRVEGFRAIIKSRYENKADFIIDEKRANEYWNELI
jgi:hypothetical protein